MEFEALWILKALLGGALGYVGRRILEGAHRKLRDLQNKPLSSKDQEFEELLGHLVEEIGDVDDLTIHDSIRVITLRAGVSKAYWQIQIQRLTAEQDKPGGV